MKNFSKGLGYVIIIVVLFLLLLTSATYFNHHYTKEGIIVGINDEVVMVEDVTGERWNFVGNGYQVGEWVKMKMDSKGTDNFYDDEIVKIKVLE